MVQVERRRLAVGKKIQLFAQPQWIEIGGPRAVNCDQGWLLQVHDLDGGSGAAAVPLPARCPSKQAVIARAVRDVCQFFAAGIEHTAVDTRFHLFHRCSAIQCDLVPLPGTSVVGFPPRNHGHRFAVGAPPGGDVIPGVPGQPSRLPPGSGDDVHVQVVFIRCGKGNVPAIG